MGAQLEWEDLGGYRDAVLGDFDGGDGVRFHLVFQGTCYRRGQWKLLIEVAHRNHNQWGCFDEADQPMRYYHNESCALLEAQAIADVLWADRSKHGPIP